MNSSQLSGKIAVITGASRGLGRASAIALAKKGAAVAINYRSSKKEVEALASEIHAAGGRAVLVEGDVSSVDGVNGFFANLDQALKEADLPTRIDVLVANAGIIHDAVIEETTPDDFDRLFNLNVKGVFFLIQQALSRMQSGGRIVTLSSGLARFSIPTYIAYGMGKGAIEVMTRYLAHYLGPRGITVNCVAPGAINTDMNRERLANEQFRDAISNMAALKRIGQPDDIADVIGFLASDESRWVTGQRIEASGGAMLGPG